MISIKSIFSFLIIAHLFKSIAVTPAKEFDNESNEVESVDGYIAIPIFHKGSASPTAKDDNHHHINHHHHIHDDHNHDKPQFKRGSIIWWGLALGLVNFVASGLQQWGLRTTSATKVGFFAGFDIVLTPVMAFCIPSLKKNGNPQLTTWIAVVLSMSGLYLLSSNDVGDIHEIGFGEMLVLISTFFWTLHITG